MSKIEQLIKTISELTISEIKKLVDYLKIKTKDM